MPSTDDVTVDARDAVQDAHPAAQPPDDRLDDDHVAGVDRPPVPHALDAGEERRAAAVLGLREDHDGADLRDRLGQDRRRQHGQLAVAVGQVALVERDVLDPDDPLVGLELGDAIDEQERIPVRAESARWPRGRAAASGHP